MVLARWPNIDNTTGKQAWHKINIGGANGFTVRDPLAAAHMAKWGGENEPWLHSYPLFAWEDSWDHFNVSTSPTEVNVTITDSLGAWKHDDDGKPSVSAATVAGVVGSPATSKATGVWVIKIAAPSGYSTPTVFCNGTAKSRFRVHKVKAGSPQDPLGGVCIGFKVPTQNILQISEVSSDPMITHTA